MALGDEAELGSASRETVIRALELVLDDDTNRGPVAEWAAQRLEQDDVWGTIVRHLHRLVMCAELDAPGEWAFGHDDFVAWRAEVEDSVESDALDGPWDTSLEHRPDGAQRFDDRES